jgi:uncharacterized OsmC-like protein
MSEKLGRAIEELQRTVRNTPGAERAEFRAVTVSPHDTFATDSTVRGFGVHMDEPTQLGGEDSGPNPVEAVLAALGSCQAIVYRAYASALGLRLDRVEVDARGKLDLRGFLGLAAVPPGYDDVSFHVRIESPEPLEKIQELARLVDEHCPVLDILRRPVRSVGTVEHVASAGSAAA